jgi:hypothetical protein
MTLMGGIIPTNNNFDFTPNTRLFMDVTIGHTFAQAHRFKAKFLQIIEASKRREYAMHYLQQLERLAFVPMIANSLGQCGPDLVQFIWNSAGHDRHDAKLNRGFLTENKSSLSSFLFARS